MASMFAALGHGVKCCVKCDIQGRSSRSEFWWSTFVIQLLMYIGFTSGQILSQKGDSTLGCIIFFGSLVLTQYCQIIMDIRRLHDRNISGKWLLCAKVPHFCAIIVSLSYIGIEYTVYRGFISLVNTGYNGLFLSISYVNGNVTLIFFILYCIKGTKGSNKYGEDRLTQNQPSPITTDKA